MGDEQTGRTRKKMSSYTAHSMTVRFAVQRIPLRVGNSSPSGQIWASAAPPTACSRLFPNATSVSVGLVQGSFIPPRDIRELRDLTRRRRTLVSDGAAEKNRVQKILEDANVKLGNVLSDVFGASGQAMLEALLENKQSPAEIAELGHWSLAPKIPQIIEALEGYRMTDHHRFMIRQCLRHMRTLEEMIEELDKEIAVRLKPYQEQVKLACPQSVGKVSETAGWG